jgi:hypothetical protein
VFLGLIAADVVSARVIAPTLARLGALFRSPPGRPAPAAATIAAVVLGVAILVLLFKLAPLSNSNVGEDAASLSDFLTPKLWRRSQLFDPVLGYDWKIDLPVLAVIALALMIYLFRGRVRVAGTILLAMAGLLIAYVFVPSGWGSTYYIPERFPFVLMLLGIAGIDIEFEHLTARRAATATILVLNLTSYATITTGAFAYVFALPDQNMVVPRPEFAPLSKAMETNNRVDHNPHQPLPNQDLGSPAALAPCTDMLVTRPTLYQLTMPPALKPIVAVPGATLYRVDHNAPPVDALPTPPALAGSGKPG